MVNVSGNAAHEQEHPPESDIESAPRRSMVVARRRSLRPGLESESFSLHFVSPLSASPADRARLLATYECWSSIWSQTFQERDGVTRIYSDDFTRQDEVAALFHRDECIAVACFRFIDLTLPQYQDDSYFKQWEQEARRLLVAEGSRICVVSYLGIRPEWRRDASSHAIKEMFSSLCIHRFVQSGADALAGAVRNDKGMNSLLYRFGAKPLQRDVIMHGGPVDLVAIYRGNEAFEAIEPDLETFALEIWARADERRSA